MIRRATLDDLGQLAYCGLLFAQGTGRCGVDMPDNTDEIVDVLATLFDLPGFRVFVFDENDVFQGGAGLLYAPMLMLPSKIAAEELFLWTLPGASPFVLLALVRAAVEDMKANGIVRQSWYELPSSPEKLKRVYQRMGLEVAQTAYSGDV